MLCSQAYIYQIVTVIDGLKNLHFFSYMEREERMLFCDISLDKNDLNLEDLLKTLYPFKSSLSGS